MRHWTIVGLIIVLTGLFGATGRALAQQPVPPEHYTLDSHGVDLVSGQFVHSETEVVIGQPGAGGLSHGRIYLNGGNAREARLGTVTVSGSTYVISIGGESEVFIKSGSTFTPQSQQGSTFSQSGTAYTFTSASGAVAHFFNYWPNVATPYGTGAILLGDYRTPDGEIQTYNYQGVNYCRLPILSEDPDNPDGGCAQYASEARLQSITNNRGYMLHFDYMDDTPGLAWLRLASVTGINLAVDYCDPYADDCTGLTQTWPSITYGSDGSGNPTATDQAGRTTTFVQGTYGLSGIQFPGSSVTDISVTVNSASQTTSLTDASGTWNYAYADVGTTRTTTATGPLGEAMTVVSDLTIGRATSVTQTTTAGASPVTRTWTYQYDAQRRLSQITNPEGDYSVLAYDARGNLTSTVAHEKPSVGSGTITTSATYPSTCSTPVTCNKPLTTTDARGNVTDYVWNTTHGGLESVTAPAPTSGAARPQTRIGYGAQTAYYKNSSGVIVAASSSITLPTSTSACATGTAPSCVGTDQETRTTVAYGSSGVANNLLPTSVTQADGTGALSVTTTTAWDHNGDRFAVDGPLAGSGDYTRYRYNAARQLVGVVGPDPDAGGGMLNRAQRITYNGRGQVTLTEAGTTPGYSDANWSSFATLQRQATEYDNWGRPVVARSQDAAGNTLALQQVGYDAAGRTQCAATRMNPGAFSSLPGATNACSQTAAGWYGPDRIVQMTYDAADRPIRSTSGVGTASTITESVSYSPNGKVKDVVDGNSGQSTYVYDGFDRLGRLHYPNPTGGGVSSTDFDWYGYDAAGNVTFYQNRAGEQITAGYDNLNRRITLGGSAVADRTFSYDNLNRPITTAFTSGGPSSTNGWDALSRLIAQTQSPLGTISYGYDAAGRKTYMQWPDGFYVNYDWSYGNDLMTIRENGATTWGLAAYTYDNLGRRITAARNNGVISGFGYDGISRLSGMTHDLPGSSQDISWGYTYNPAGQIISRSVSNNAYVYTPASTAVAYVNNMLNRLTSINGSAVGYDGRGNITSAPGATYGYNAENQMTSASTGAGSSGYAFDPTGRLYQAIGATNRRYLYDGQQVIAEYDGSGVIQGRYVPGLGLNDVVTSYDAGGNRSWWLSDERQSVVALTNGSGAAFVTNTYDEYGVPAASNAGLFQYTGQMWLPDAQLYHYRARAYAPQIGRFMQADPLGYGAGMNVYGYVGGDPVNLVDPMGLDPLVVGGRTTEDNCRQEHGRVGKNDKGETVCFVGGPANPVSSGSRGSGSGTGGGGGNGSDPTTCPGTSPPSTTSVDSPAGPVSVPTPRAGTGVAFDNFSAMGAYWVAGGLTVGRYTYEADNGVIYSGLYAAPMLGAGMGASASINTGVSPSFNQFFGWSVNVNVAGGIGSAGVSVNGGGFGGSLGVGRSIGTMAHADVSYGFPLGQPSPECK